MNVSKAPNEVPVNSDIRIVGDRASGKTTFMGALSYWPNAYRDTPILSVDPFNQETSRLVQQTQDILMRRDQFSRNKFIEDPEKLPLYSLWVELKPKFTHNPIKFLKKEPISFQVSCRDHPGELMENLRSNNRNDDKLQRYLDDLAEVSNILYMIDGKSFNKDQDARHAEKLKNLESELNLRLANKEDNIMGRYRIALVFSKFEQSEILGERTNLNVFIKKFSKTQTVLQRWREKWRCSTEIFACSSFGTMGRPPRPNFEKIDPGEKESYGVLARPDVWRPFGLVAPIYWLCTGKIDSRLRDI